MIFTCKVYGKFAGGGSEVGKCRIDDSLGMSKDGKDMRRKGGVKAKEERK
jgi:hypothetical protein